MTECPICAATLPREDHPSTEWGGGIASVLVCPAAPSGSPLLVQRRQPAQEPEGCR